MLYPQYLQTKHWKDTRIKKLDTANHCQFCNTTSKLNIHHKRYYLPEEIAQHKNREAGSVLFREDPDDLFTLCVSCHKLWHFYYGKTYLRHKIASKIRRLIKLGCMPREAIRLSKEQFAYNIILNLLKENNIGEDELPDKP
jgi:hypothetical protein